MYVRRKTCRPTAATSENRYAIVVSVDSALTAVPRQSTLRTLCASAGCAATVSGQLSCHERPRSEAQRDPHHTPAKCWPHRAVLPPPPQRCIATTPVGLAAEPLLRFAVWFTRWPLRPGLPLCKSRLKSQPARIVWSAEQANSEGAIWRQITTFHAGKQANTHYKIRAMSSQVPLQDTVSHIPDVMGGSDWDRFVAI